MPQQLKDFLLMLLLGLLVLCLVFVPITLSLILSITSNNAYWLFINVAYLGIIPALLYWYYEG